MHPRSAKYFKSETLVLGPKERRIVVGDKGAEVATAEGSGDSGVSFERSNAPIRVKRSDGPEEEEASQELESLAASSSVTTSIVSVLSTNFPDAALSKVLSRSGTWSSSSSSSLSIEVLLSRTDPKVAPEKACILRR
jgi:hypothetical protein